MSLVLYTITPIPYILGVFYRRRDILLGSSQEQAIDQAEEPVRMHAEND